MDRAIFGGSFLCVLFLLIGTFAFPNNMVMDLASTSVVATIFRMVMAVILLVVLFTSPPRRPIARLTMGATALVLLSLGVGLSLGANVHVLDIILFLELGCTLGIESLEFDEEEMEARTEQLHETYNYRYLTLPSLAQSSGHPGWIGNMKRAGLHAESYVQRYFAHSEPEHDFKPKTPLGAHMQMTLGKIKKIADQPW